MVGQPLLVAWCWSWHPIFTKIPFSYGYNQLVAAHAGNAGNLAKVQRPANVLVFADAAHKDAVPEQVIFAQWWPSPDIIAPRIVYANICGVACNPQNAIEENTRHHSGSVLTFLDGHTKFIQHSQIWARALELTGLDQLNRFQLQ